MSDVFKIKNNVTSTSINNLMPKVVNNQVKMIENISKDIPEELDLLSSNTLNYEKIIADGYTPQGITTIDGQIFITAYKTEEKSRIYIYDKITNEYKGVLILNNKAHVGGISYDEENGIIFVTGSNGKVNTYSYPKIKRVINNKQIIKNGSSFTIPFSDDENDDFYFQIKNDININFSEEMDSKAATVYYYDGRIYIGSFEGIGPGILVSYDLSYNQEDNTINTSDVKMILLPNATQGIAVTDYNNSKYLITAQSVGTSKSTITIFKKHGDEYEHGRIYLNDPGIEGIEVNSKGEVIAVFENGRNEVLATNIEELEESYDYYSLTDEFLQSIMGVGYEAKAKFKEIKELLKEFNHDKAQDKYKEIIDFIKELKGNVT